MSKRFIITENEKSHIRGLYGLLVEQKNATGCTFSDVYKNRLSDYNEIISKYGNDVNKVAEALTVKAKEILQNVKNKDQNENIELRSACQVALNTIRPNYQDKPWLIIDQIKNTVYFFNNGGTYLTGTLAIMGKDKPSKEFDTWSKMSYDERVKSGLGDPISRVGGRFAPTGVFDAGQGQTYTQYTGAGTPEDPKKNLWSYFDESGKELTQAIHGVKDTKERTDALACVNGTTLTKDTNLDLSMGCINVPTSFLDKLKNMGIDISKYKIFSLGDKDYLVKNLSNTDNSNIT
jgi:hypothetical protein